MLESQFQHDLIKKLKKQFPDCFVLKNDATYIQGFPDLLILYKDKWAALECKKTSKSSKRPNQEYYVAKLDAMSFSAFVSPENCNDIMQKLQAFFEGGQ